MTYTYIRLRDKEAVIDGIPVIDKLSIKDALTALRSRGVSLGAPERDRPLWMEETQSVS